MKHAILKVAFFFGLVSGGVAFTFFLFLYWKATDPLNNGRLLMDCLSGLLFVIAALLYFRKVIRGGWLHFWEALSIGFLTNLLSALVSAVLILLFITKVDTSVLPTHLHQLEQMLLLRKKEYVILAGEDNFKRQLEQTRLTTPMDMFWDELGKKGIIGFFLVLFVSILLRRQTYSIINPGGPTEKTPG
ncbi:MAG: DUF4199 domain-containing protein [Bacteroidota bacterium]